MNSMKIGTYQMDTTFGLYLPEYTIPAPAVQTNFVKIIGRDGSVDLSNALGLHYDSRTWSLDFKCFDPTVNWHTLSSQVMNAIHGKRLNFEFDDDPNYFWTGRVSVQNYVSNHGTGTLKVTIVSDPFKYAKLSTIVTKTASIGTEYTGELVTFNTANAKINDLSVTMQPIQDLHGYDHPWPAGGGKNKLDYLSCVGIGERNGTESVYGNNTSISGSELTIKQAFGDDGGILKGVGTFALAHGEYVTISGKATLTGTSFLVVGVSNYNGGGTNNINFSVQVVNGRFSVTLEAKSDYEKTGIFLQPKTSGSTAVVSEVMVALGQTEQPYSPYSNICPISGRTGVNVYRTGKNLIDGSKTYQQGVNQLILGQEAAYSTRSIFLKAGQYIVSVVLSKTATIYLATDTNTGGSSIGNTTSARTFTLAEDSNISMWLYTSNGVTASDLTSVQLELGSTATTYEPYNGNTYAIDWATPAGTVYGGTLDVVTGVLTVSWACASRRLSTFNLIETKTNTKHYRYFDNFFGGSLPANSVSGNLCNIAPNAYSNSDATHFYPVTGTGRIELWVPVDLSADTEVQIAVPIATPLTYQLTAQEVEALVGTNNVWSDGGNVTVAVVTPETLTNNGRAVVPTLTASADMVLKWGNYSASVQQGTSTIPQLILENGANLVYIIGTGSISFTWQEVSL